MSEITSDLENGRDGLVGIHNELDSGNIELPESPYIREKTIPDEEFSEIMANFFKQNNQEVLLGFSEESEVLVKVFYKAHGRKRRFFIRFTVRNLDGEGIPLEVIDKFVNNGIAKDHIALLVGDNVEFVESGFCSATTPDEVSTKRRRLFSQYGKWSTKGSRAPIYNSNNLQFKLLNPPLPLAKARVKGFKFSNLGCTKRC